MATIIQHEVTNLVEPFDPAYLTDPEDPNPCVLSRSEIMVARKTAILQNKLHKNRITYAWESECFRIRKERSTFTDYRYLWVDEETGAYCYGTLEKVIEYDSAVGVVIERALNFLK